MRNFSGILPALLTLFSAAGTVNVPVLKDLVDYFAAKQVDGLYICGNTGDGMFMTVEERKLVAETVMEQAPGSMPIIVHIGSVSIIDAIDLARHAQKIGAAGISSILPPLYTETASLLAYFNAIASAVPDLPFLPYIFGGNLDAVSFMRQLMQNPNIVGTKYTGANMFELRKIIELGAGREAWSVFAGMDEQAIFAGMMGASGHIGTTINLMPGAYRQIRAYYLAGDFAAAHAPQLRTNKVVEVLISVGVMSANKKAMHMLGFDCGTRLPNLPPEPRKLSQLQVGLDAIGFAELAAM